MRRDGVVCTVSMGEVGELPRLTRDIQSTVEIWERADMITVNDVMALPEIQIGNPSVVAGTSGMSNEVRWVHVSDLPDIGQLLQGGELILTTGLGLGSDTDDYRSYVQNLAAMSVSGLVVELGRRFSSLPVPLLKAADRCSLPVIQLGREVRFVDVTQAVHSQIVDSQLKQLRRSELIHQAFTELTVEGAPVEDILNRAASLAGHALVLENLAHQVLAVADLKAVPRSHAVPPARSRSPGLPSSPPSCRRSRVLALWSSSPNCRRLPM